jgi:molybdopterin-binding protein
MQLSARNQIPATVVSSEVTAVIKASDVILAID